LPTSDVQNNIFTGFLDPENAGLAVGIAFLSALDPNLREITLIWRPSWNPIWPTPEVQTNDFAGFLDLEDVVVGTGIRISICLSFIVIGKSMCNMAAILKFKMAATRGRFRVGS